MRTARLALAAVVVSSLSGCLFDPLYCWESDKTKCCTDAKVTDVETDIDCGGGICGACGDGKVCLAATDCLSGVCTDGVCAAPTCSDQVKNGTESDKDCGGATCPKCGVGLACAAATDCASSSCKSNACAAPACDDDVKNGSETDKDCGGSCEGCDVGGECDDDNGNCLETLWCNFDSLCEARLDCAGITECAGACSSQSCISGCRDAGTESGGAAFDAVISCTYSNCLSDCLSGNEATCEACVSTNCAEETAACDTN